MVKRLAPPLLNPKPSCPPPRFPLAPLPPPGSIAGLRRVRPTTVRALTEHPGARALMEQVAPSGPVYQAGTYAAHPLAIAAGLATFDVIDSMPDLYEVLERRAARLQEGLTIAAQAAGVPVSFQRVGSMWTVFFSSSPISSWNDARCVDREAYGRFFRGMLARGILLPPSPFESGFLSLAHNEEIVDQTIQAAREAFKEASL